MSQSMSRYVCVHGHFYQPPRENPWLETVETQESAAPWHDWNDRITAECYRRNTAARILDADGNIKQICNNYSRMSFNVGPTLLSWLKDKAPRCYQGILEADALGIQRFSGHGPALGQVYNHIILPLANRRDKATQVKWGIADFKSRFGRTPEGMWLAETAVDTETLEVLAENGIRFTLLSPKQASEVRFMGDPPDAWHDVKWEKVDTGMAYQCNLPSGRHIALFFYNGGLSQAIAFGGLLNDGGYFARTLIEGSANGAGRPTLSHVATDGESYGHHHQHGDMAIAYCLESVDRSPDANLTVYGEFLEKNPPVCEVRIVENSSWSCAHGVERWRSDCGCSGGTPGYHQKWRAPLRAALDWLRDKLAGQFEHEAAKYLKNPWEARDEYIEVILDRSRESVKKWLAAQASHPLTDEESVRALKFLESQRSALLMYTSCGWFFDEISGLETVQILRYAARAIDLIHELTELNFEIEFTRLLENAPSNVPEFENGKRVYELLVKPAQLSFERLAAHYGMVFLFPDLPSNFSEDSSEGFKGRVTSSAEAEARHPSGSVGEEDSKAFATGEVEIECTITWEKKKFLFAANYRGGTALVCGVLPDSEDAQKKVLGDFSSLKEVFTQSQHEKMVEIFGHRLFSLRHILHDQQRALLNQLLQRDVDSIESSLHDIVRDYGKLIEFLLTLGIHAPAVIRSAASIALTGDVVHSLETEVPDINALRDLITRARSWNVELDKEKITVALNAWALWQMREIYDSPANVAQMQRLSDMLASFLNEFKWQLDLYEVQNLYHATRSRLHQQIWPAPDLASAFHKLGKALRFSEEALR